MGQVILVDENDQEIGQEEKIKAHSDGGKLHRAFSIFVINSKGELMMQKRAKTKYHCGELWSNTCCSHPKPGEEIVQAAHRRLQEEMGFDCDLKEGFSLIYKVPFDNGLTEFEFDHFLFGNYDSEPKINPEEADEWKWIKIEDLEKDVAENPDFYTPWLKIALPRVVEYLKSS